MKRTLLTTALGALSVFCLSIASAQAADAPPAEIPAPADKPKPPPYSLPFQLRPVVAGTVLRSDSTYAFYESPTTRGGSTLASTLLGSYKLTDELAPLVRVGFVKNSPPTGPSGTNFLNPVLGGTYALKLSPELKLGLFLGLTVPVGSGGGNSSKPENRAANGAGILARSAMDNAMFAVNYFTVFPGAGIAYVSQGLTVQAEATVLELTRVKGENFDKDSSRTNFTSGLHVGYFLMPMLSLGAELRHQRWLSTPTPVKANSALRDTTTVAFGPRFHVKLSEKSWVRPALALALPVDEPMSKAKYKVIQLDIPVIF
ncbi:MAG: hypothetical protein SFV15_00130 [Polyangiaceae bacterium]|nr:hypothetical protein [Polyangiaceae bacterium]